MSDELIMLADGSGHFGVAYHGEPIKAFSFGISSRNPDAALNATINEESARQLLEFLEEHLHE